MPAETWASNYRLGTVGRWMVAHIAARALLVTLALSVPVILISLRVHVPPFALSPERMARMVLAISGMILSNSIPALVAVAIVWTFFHFAADGLVTALRNAGRSATAIAMPALIVALAATGIGLGLTNGIGPGGARTIHDTIFFLRRDFNIGLLTPGEFHEFDREGVTIYFGRKVSDAVVRDVFIQQSSRTSQTQKVYKAETAVLGGTHGARALVLLNGSAIIANGNATHFRQVRFQRAVWWPSTAGQSRSSVHFDEMQTPALVASAGHALADPKLTRFWLREVVKRFLFPCLALSHALLVLSALFAWGMNTDRDRSAWIASTAVGGLILVIHAIFVFLSEITGLIGAVAVGGFVLLFGLEIAGAIVLFRHADDPSIGGRVRNAVAEAGNWLVSFRFTFAPRARKAAKRAG
ncbi:MAG: LptF/LptG family permease [Rhodobiaceae bacterium]|nr:LptF/LptG family permease [Rhodobiaceae bacterium]